MAALSRVEWLGAEITAKVVEATMAAIDETTKAAADDARQNHWWNSVTGNLERNVKTEASKLEGPLVVGKFGADQQAEGFYGLFLERKTPWLRPAADRTFHTLGLKIKAGLRWT